MDYRKFDFKLMGDDAMSWKLTEIEDHAPVVKQNQRDKQFGNNGWTPGRKQRRLARIPIDVIQAAEKMGYNMKGTGVYKFLADYPEYLVVPYVKSPSNGSAQSQGRVIVR